VHTHTRLLSEHDLPAPIDDRWFEDYIVGASYDFGSVTVSEDDIVGFARQYDPQPIHTDPAWAAEGPFHGLIASGIQTVAVVMRMYVDHYISRVASLASPGVDELRWLRPLRPGDELRMRVTVAAARVSESKPDRGLVHTKVEGFNQDGEPVVGFVAMNFLARRPAG
jgi:acyl dehydratase